MENIKNGSKGKQSNLFFLSINEKKFYKVYAKGLYYNTFYGVSLYLSIVSFCICASQLLPPKSKACKQG